MAGKIIVTGASGMVGSSLCPELTVQGYDVLKTDINILDKQTQKYDVREIGQLEALVRKGQPDLIIHLAAETNVDRCELEKEHALMTNTLGTENVALVCQKHDIPLVYISTAAVFDGKKRDPYNELDTPAPTNFYGDSKLGGEVAVMRLLKRWYLFRAGWMVGGFENDKKFVNKIITQIKEGATEIIAVTDKQGSLTFTSDFSKNIIEVVKQQRFGLYHMTNNGGGTRYDVAKAIIEYAGAKDSVRAVPCTSARFPLPAPRSDSEMMDNTKLKLLGLYNMRNWRDALREYVQRPQFGFKDKN